VDIAFLCGLYDPVPIEDAEHPALLPSDFLLQKGDEASYARIRERLIPFLGLYERRVAYLAPPAYREAVKGLPVPRGFLAGRVRASNLSILLDTAVFIATAFAGTGAPLLPLIGSQAAVKFPTSLFLIPLLYHIRASLKEAQAG